MSSLYSALETIWQTLPTSAIVPTPAAAMPAPSDGLLGRTGLLRVRTASSPASEDFVASSCYYGSNASFAKGSFRITSDRESALRIIIRQGGHGLLRMELQVRSMYETRILVSLITAVCQPAYNLLGPFKRAKAASWIPLWTLDVCN